MSLEFHKMATCLWFNKQAEEAVNFYTTIFKNSKIGRIARYGKSGYEIHGMPEGSVLTIDFELEGQQFVALNAGPEFQFNESISFIVNCETQEEIDYYWDKLSEGGDEAAQVCGWLKDKFGVSWQIVPTALTEMMSDPDSAKADRVFQAMFQMKKLDIAKLREAYEAV